MEQAPVLTHKSADLIAFCRAVRNHLEQASCADHISKDGTPVLCGLINEQNLQKGY